MATSANSTYLHVLPVGTAECADTTEIADLNYVIDLIYRRCRIRLHEGKHQLIRARLAKRIRQHGFASLHEYCQFLRREAGEEELSQVVDALTTNFTHFLRERDHFDFLVQRALPDLLSRGKGRKSFAIWSAACATGEEPYTLAFYLAESYPVAAGWDWQVLATDISGRALRQAQDAIYREEKLTGLPPEWIRKYFQRGTADWEGHYRVKPWLREKVQFRQINLLGTYEFARTFDVIFCRNVMIYFDRPTQETLVNHLSRFLIPGGYLLVGHSESLIGLSIALKCCRPSIYHKSP